jgi:hypothetical protein
VLEEAGLVEIWKGYQDRRPQTLCRLSKTGRRRFLDYVDELERVVQDVASARELGRTLGSRPKLPEGWAPA